MKEDEDKRDEGFSLEAVLRVAEDASSFVRSGRLSFGEKKNRVDIGRLMRSIFLCLWRLSSTKHGPRGNHALHQSLRLRLLQPSDEPA